jgi:poly-gamma-glutamate synthesis protein (capsule biosynthesis protein)
MKSAADGGALVVAYVHWGVEYDTCPRASQKQIADDLIAAGAQVIVGAHPHVLQGVGYKSGALVDYSLGNFAWYGHAGTPSIVLRISVKDGHVLGFSTTPVMWDKRGLPHEVTGTKATKVAQVLAKRSRCDDLKSVP